MNKSSTRFNTRFNNSRAKVMFRVKVRVLVSVCCMSLPLMTNWAMAESSSSRVESNMAESTYTNTQAMPVGNTAPPEGSGLNPNPESPAVYPQNQENIQRQPSDKDKDIIYIPKDKER